MKPARTTLFLAVGFLILATGCARDRDPNLPYSGQTLQVFNWSDYIDETLIPEFEKRTGAKVVYTNYSDDGGLETKLLNDGGPYDVVFPSDRSMTGLVKKDKLAELDRSLLPNWKNLDPKFLGRRFDPKNRWSVPYFWGTLAIGIRTDHVKEPVQGFEVLFDERYKGRITMLDDPEHVVAVALLYLGLPMNSTDPEHLAKAKALLQKQAPFVQAYITDGFKDKLIKDEAWVVMGWSGDIMQARVEEKKVKAIVPASGTLVWVDSMAIPKNAANPRLAHEFINFLLDAQVAGRNANFVKYASPNQAGRAHIDQNLLNDPVIYPPAKVLERCQWLEDRGPAFARIEEVWKAIRK